MSRRGKFCVTFTDEDGRRCVTICRGRTRAECEQWIDGADPGGKRRKRAADYRVDRMPDEILHMVDRDAAHRLEQQKVRAKLAAERWRAERRWLDTL